MNIFVSLRIFAILSPHPFHFLTPSVHLCLLHHSVHNLKQSGVQIEEAERQKANIARRKTKQIAEQAKMLITNIYTHIHIQIYTLTHTHTRSYHITHRQRDHTLPKF